MRAIEKIRRYIRHQKAAGCLRPGDQLPSYHDLMKMAGASYATILTAMKALESEGLLEIRNGNGSYLSGGKRLPVRILHNPQVISASRLVGIFEKHLLHAGLNLDVEMYPLMLLADPVEWQRFVREERFAVIISSDSEVVPAPANLSMMPDEYNDIPMFFPGDIFHLPFAFSPSMLLYNPDMVERIGFPCSLLDCSFSWWEDFAIASRKHGIHPAAINWQLPQSGSFVQTIGLLLALSGGKGSKGTGDDFSFSSDIGRRFLSILRDTFFYNSEQGVEGSFFRNGACLNFSAGVWTSVQSQNPERSDIAVKRIRPLPDCGQKRKQILAVKYYLSAYFGESTAVEERNRIWALMQIMCSRNFHLDFCNASGLISARKDIGKRDCQWNQDGLWDPFFPINNDQLIFVNDIFPPNSVPALSTLLEDFIFYGSDAEVTLQRMDGKIANNPWAFDYKTGRVNLIL